MQVSKQGCWKTALIGAMCLVGAGLTAVAWASPERPYCSDWNEWWYHHLTTVSHIRYCIHSGQVEINQRDDQERTLLHRLASDSHRGSKRIKWYHPDGRCCLEARGTGRKTRRGMVKELLRWEQLDLEAVDPKGWTALRYALRKRRGWSTATLLLNAGAQVHLRAKDKDAIVTQGLPLVKMANERFADPFAGEVDIADLADCETADCLVDEIEKD